MPRWMEHASIRQSKSAPNSQDSQTRMEHGIRHLKHGIHRPMKHTHTAPEPRRLVSPPSTRPLRGSSRLANEAKRLEKKHAVAGSYSACPIGGDAPLASPAPTPPWDGPPSIDSEGPPDHGHSPSRQVLMTSFPGWRQRPSDPLPTLPQRAYGQNPENRSVVANPGSGSLATGPVQAAWRGVRTKRLRHGAHYAPKPVPL